MKRTTTSPTSNEEPPTKRVKTLPVKNPYPTRFEAQERIEWEEYTPFVNLVNPVPIFTKGPDRPAELRELWPLASSHGHFYLHGLLSYPYTIMAYGIEIYGKKPQKPEISIPWTIMGMFFLK